MKVFDKSLSQVERALDVRLARHAVLAGNVANVDTPGYRPKEINFSEAMRGALDSAGTIRRTDDQHFDVSGGGVGVAPSAGGEASAGIRVQDATGVSPSLDGNRVDVDRTMTDLAENAIQYQANSRAAQKKLAVLRYVVSDGNG